MVRQSGADGDIPYAICTEVHCRVRCTATRRTRTEKDGRRLVTGDYITELCCDDTSTSMASCFSGGANVGSPTTCGIESSVDAMGAAGSSDDRKRMRPAVVADCTTGHQRHA